MKWLLGLVVLVGCGKVGTDTGTGNVNGTHIGYIDPVYVKTMNHEGRTYHVFNSSRSIFVIDVTEKNSKN